MKFKPTALVVALGLTGVMVMPAQAGTITINDGANSYTCNVGTAGLFVNSAGNATVGVINCNPLLASGGTGDTGGGTGGDGGTGDTGGGTGDTGGDGGTGDTGGGTNPPPPPPSTGTGDPGTGLWLPAGTTGLSVADPTQGSTTSYLPGCINMPYNSSCARSTSYNDGAGNRVTLEKGKVLALRFKTGDKLTEGASFTIAGGVDNGNVGRSITMSLSGTPGEFTNVGANCVTTSNTKPQINTGTTSTTLLWGMFPVDTKYCLIQKNTGYYVNIRVNDACLSTDPTCRVRLQGNSDFN